MLPLQKIIKFQNGWASPSVDNPTDLSQASVVGIPAPSPLGHPDCPDGSNQANFLTYQNYGTYYASAPTSEDQIYHQTAEKHLEMSAGLMTANAGFAAVSTSGHQRARQTRSGNFDPAKLNFSFRTDPQSPSNRSSSDQ